MQIPISDKPDACAGTPSCPETLYHMEVLEDYEHLGLRCGVSSGSEFPASLDSSTLSSALFW